MVAAYNRKPNMNTDSPDFPEQSAKCPAGDPERGRSKAGFLHGPMALVRVASPGIPGSRFREFLIPGSNVQG